MLHQIKHSLCPSIDNKSVYLQDTYLKLLFVLMQFAVSSLTWKCGNSSWMTARFDKIFNNANFPDKGLKQNTILFVQVWILFEHVELECGWLVCKLYSLLSSVKILNCYSLNCM